jgi:hypothetical protein
LTTIRLTSGHSHTSLVDDRTEFQDAEALSLSEVRNYLEFARERIVAEKGEQGLSK